MDERLTGMGKAEGLDFDLAAIAFRPNTNAAHRLIRWAGPAAGPAQRIRRWAALVLGRKAMAARSKSRPSALPMPVRRSSISRRRAGSGNRLAMNSA